MKASGPKHERETIINFNEEEEKIWIWTASQIIYNRLLKRLGRQYLTEDGDRHAIFKFPQEWLILPRARTKRVLNPSQKAQLRNQLAKAPQAQGAPEQKRGILK